MRDSFFRPAKGKRARPVEEESESSSSDLFSSQPEHSEASSSEVSEHKETPAEKRLRLAQAYLAQLSATTDSDSRSLGARLQEEVDRLAGKHVIPLANQVSRALRGISPNAPSMHVYRGSRHGPATCVALTADGTRAYTGCSDGSFTCWDISPSTALPDLPHVHPLLASARKLWRVSPSKRGHLTRGKAHPLLYGSNKQNRGPCDGHMAAVLAIAVSPDGTLLATGGRDNLLILWDAVTGRCLDSFAGHRDAITGLSFAPEAGAGEKADDLFADEAGKEARMSSADAIRPKHVLFSTSADRSLRVHAMGDRCFLSVLYGHSEACTSVAAIADDRAITGSEDRSLRCWRVIGESQLIYRGVTGKLKAVSDRLRGADAGSSIHDSSDEEDSDSDTIPDIESAALPAGPAAAHDLAAVGAAAITTVAAFSGGSFVSGSQDGTLSLWSASNKKPVARVPLTPVPLPTLGSSVRAWSASLAATPGSDLALSGCADGHLRFFEAQVDAGKLKCIGSVPIKGYLTGIALTVSNMGPSHSVQVVAPKRSNAPARRRMLTVVASVSSEPRLGRWDALIGVKNGLTVLRIPLDD
jgi:ribosomal RNA-processing protein 9